MQFDKRDNLIMASSLFKEGKYPDDAAAPHTVSTMSNGDYFELVAGHLPSSLISITRHDKR